MALEGVEPIDPIPWVVIRIYPKRNHWEEGALSWGWSHKCER